MQDILSKLASQIGPAAIIDGKALEERQLPRGISPGALLRPSSTLEVSSILKACFESQQPVVPIGGMTGLVYGCNAEPHELALSLERMNRIEQIDIQSRTMVVEAGTPLQTIQEASEKEGMMFPLDLGSRGSATIGGNVATNAGGNRVIRYGMVRDQILGMEVVLADGTILSSMNKVIKNNTGYDLKQFFIGSEGTLGIVTRLVLRLRPRPLSQNMAFIGVNSFDQVTGFLNYIDTALGGSLSAFEVLWDDFYQLVTQPPAHGRPPINGKFPYYILLEAQGGNIEGDQQRFLQTMEHALLEGLIDDAVIAQSQAERDALWAIRDDVMQVGQNAPISTFDISVSLDEMESYVAELRVSLDHQWPNNTCMIFGHLGDGNLHIIVGVGKGDAETKQSVEASVYGGLPGRGGSISAEHGIGLQKKHHLDMSRTEPEIQLMKTIKQALDPRGILNPGKIF